MGDDLQLSEKIEWAFDHPEEMKEMGLATGREFEEKYSAEKSYEQLIDIYREAMRSL